MKAKGIAYSYTSAALKALVAKSQGGKFGARDLRRVIRKAVEDPAAEKLIDGALASGSSLVVKEYINNMPELLAAADLVISRAGALTLAELEAVGRAAILIPSPNVAENHQYYNAMELQKAGAAVVIEEKDLTGEALVATVADLLAEPGKLAQMGRNARKLSVDDSLDRIANALLQLVKTP